MKHWIYLFIFGFGSFLLFLSGCNKRTESTLKIAATSMPHAEILEFVKPMLKLQNIELEILMIDDFNTPNRALADKEVDANFFQHRPFLEAQSADFGYSFESLTPIHLEPMAAYTKKGRTLASLKDHAIIAMPSDPSNQARALALCEQLGLLTLKTKGANVGLLDIETNPHQFRFIEMDSHLLCHSLEDVDLALISTNFALLAGLSPTKDALGVENEQSKFVNIVVIRKGESQRPELQRLKNALTSEQVRNFIENQYQGAVIPVFD